ncbi:ABC transporter ATP-binding protein [Chloroflexota bacterium]
MLLQVNNLSKYFGELSALSNVTFNVNDGEIFGIAGPNGSGKTTLFNVITGILSYSGDITFNGQSINGLKPYQICHRGISRTFQIPLIFSTMTVRQNLEIGARFGNEKQRNIERNINEVVSLLGLQEKENDICSNLNLFDKKATMIAAALTTRPKLLLLDEPAGGLSPAEIEQLLDLIRVINRESSITIIIIEHLMKVIMGVCERLMMLSYGETICIGSPSEVAEDRRVIDAYLGGA